MTVISITNWTIGIRHLVDHAEAELNLQLGKWPPSQGSSTPEVATMTHSPNQLVGGSIEFDAWAGRTLTRVNRVLSPIDFILLMLTLFGIGLLIGIYWRWAW